MLRTQALFVALVAALLGLAIGPASGQDLERRLADFERLAPGIGDPAPEFSLDRVTGAEAELRGFLEQGPVVLEFACLSCPEALDRAEREALAAEFGPKGVQFVLIFSREENAGGRVGVHDYSSLRDAKSDPDRRDLARRFQRESATGWSVLVDSIDNKVWRDYGRLPNAAYVLSGGGTVLYRESWADAENLRLALTEVFEGGFHEEKPAPRNAELAARGDGEGKDGGMGGAKDGDKDGDKDGPGANGPDKGDGDADKAGWEKEYDRWVRRGERVGRAIGAERGQRREMLNRYAKKAADALREAQKAREANNWRLAYQKWEEYTRLVADLEKELGIEPDEDHDDDRGGRGGRGGRGRR